MKRLLVGALLVKERVAFATAFSVALHAFLLFGISFTVPDMRNLQKKLEPLEVTLVNAKSRSTSSARAYAQNNLDGGGNVEEDRHAASPFPVLGNDKRFTPEQAAQRVKSLEQEVKRLLTQKNSNYRLDQRDDIPQEVDSKLSGQDLVQRSLEIARLEAEINKNLSLYEKMPKRKFLGTRTKEYRYAQYEEDWRSKVERIGTLNYPEALRRQKIFGSVTITVNIRADGSVESVDVDKSSGNHLLDAAAVRIAKLAAPYAPFPPDIRKETDILSIPRVWTFTTTDQLETK